MRTSATRSTRSASSTRGSPVEASTLVRDAPAAPASRSDLRRHRAGARVHRLEDRSLEDVARALERVARLVSALARDHGRDRLADGVALATAARGARNSRPADVARPLVFFPAHRPAAPPPRA